MTAPPKYTFLEVIRESEAIARGANLSDKINHAVYKAIRNASTQEAARSLNLFTLDTFVPDIINLTKKDLKTVVSRLITDKVVVQIFRLEFEPAVSKIFMKPCFICNQSDEKITAPQVFVETIQQSLKALISLMDSRPYAGADAFWKDLEKDLVSEQLPTPEELPATILDLFSSVHASKFDIVPNPELISVTLAELRAEVLRTGRVFEILEYGYMPIRKEETLELFETAAKFLKHKLIPMYKNRGNMKRELEQITLEETAHSVDEFAPDTEEYHGKRASILKKNILSGPVEQGGFRYPGSLAVEVILSMNDSASERYQETHIRNRDDIIQSFKESLLGKNPDWEDNIKFVEHSETRFYAPEVWRSIMSDPALYNTLWQSPGNTQYAFVRRDPETFRILVEGMLERAPLEKWRILAMKTLLEQNEGDLKGLFDDPSFLASYGRVLRNAYIDYIPWYYKIFFVMGLNLFQDKSFHIAKSRIQGEQAYLERKNSVQNAKQEKELEMDRQDNLRKIKDLTLSNQIVDILDRYFLVENKIPTLGEVFRELGSVEMVIFRNTLKSEGFPLLRADRKDNPANSILLYPLNYEWRKKAAKLRKALDNALASITGDSEETRKYTLQVGRIQKYLSNPEGEAAVSTSPDDDPYKDFENAMKAHEQRAQAE